MNLESEWCCLNLSQDCSYSESSRELKIIASDTIENAMKNQNEIDGTWSQIKELFLSELNQLPDLPQSLNKKSNSNFIKSKKFWNDDLSNYWRSMCNSEKQYLRFKVRTPANHAIKRDLLKSYKTAQKDF